VNEQDQARVGRRRRAGDNCRPKPWAKAHLLVLLGRQTSATARPEGLLHLLLLLLPNAGETLRGVAVGGLVLHLLLLLLLDLLLLSLLLLLLEQGEVCGHHIVGLGRTICH